MNCSFNFKLLFSVQFYLQYLKTLQLAEELKKENEFKERECADQIALEIQKVKVVLFLDVLSSNKGSFLSIARLKLN